MSTYICLSCERNVDRDNEPSPDPWRCPDCSLDLDRELRDGLQSWGMGGDAA